MIADATILTSAVFGRIPLGSLWTAAMAASVPCPDASGAKRYTSRPEISPPRPTTSGIAQGRAKWPAAVTPPSLAGDGGVYPPTTPSRKWVESSSNVTNAIAPSPATAPMSTPSTSHLVR